MRIDNNKVVLRCGGPGGRGSGGGMWFVVLFGQREIRGRHTLVADVKDTASTANHDQRFGANFPILTW